MCFVSVEPYLRLFVGCRDHLMRLCVSDMGIGVGNSISMQFIVLVSRYVHPHLCIHTHTKRSRLILFATPPAIPTLSIRRIRPRHRRQLRLPLIPNLQQLLLIIQQLLPRLRRILRIRALHNRIHGTALLAETAVYALRHIDIIACRSA